uniref:Uncharacterized protein n=1 Tax=Parascaris equorum TaxID=6256 RepID=A0A914RK36_PAREQ
MPQTVKSSDKATHKVFLGYPINQLTLTVCQLREMSPLPNFFARWYQENERKFDTGALFADGHLNIDEKPEWTCVDLVSAQIEAKMRANQIDFRNHFLASLSQPDKLAVTCRQTVLLKADSDDFNLVSREIPFHLKKFYRETLNELNKCSENERLAPSALLIALQIVCVSRHQGDHLKAHLSAWTLTFNIKK